MSTKLLSLQITSKSPNNGWESELLEFGSPITLLKGPNGSGKTPLILSILHCLGYQSVFRKDILDNCRSSILKLKINDSTFEIEREFEKSGKWTVKDLSVPGDVTVSFAKDLDFSRWFFEAAALPFHKLTNSNQKEFSYPYTSTLLPICYIDQTHGWQQLYAPANKFIKDQYQEMIRLNFGLGPKNPFEKKDALYKEKQNLLKIEELVDQRAQILSELEKSSDTISEPRSSLEQKKVQLSSRLTQIRSQLTSLNARPTPFETELNDLQLTVAQLINRRSEASLRISSADAILKEIESEIEALSLNADAANRFRKFCKNSTCQMFGASEEAYGKSLLYLKDQMKDLSKDTETLQATVKNIDGEISTLRNQIVQTEKAIDQFSAASGVSDTKKLLESVSSDLIAIEVKLAYQNKIEEQRQKYHNLINSREQSIISVEKLQVTSRGSSDKDIATARKELGDLMIKWIEILKTPNKGKVYKYDENFNLQIDEEKLASFKGSTLTRIVLAHHASVIELALSKNKKHLGFCIMDTPMQQEIKVTDLQEYFTELQRVIHHYSNRIQLCISFSDANIVAKENDKVWSPSAVGADGKPKYLKTLRK